MLLDTLHQVFTSSIRLENLQCLEVPLYQEGADQRVWCAQATLIDGRSHAFGLIVARAPGAETAVTQRDFLQSKKHAITAWQKTRQYWMAYVDAVQANIYPDSWWFPIAEIPAMLNQLTPAANHQ
jgi:hypothetical protein